MTDKIIQVGDAYNFSANGVISGIGDGSLVGMLCSTASGATLTLVDGKGRTLVNAMPLTAGQFYPMPFNVLGGLTATITGTANCTIAAVNG